MGRRRALGSVPLWAIGVVLATAAVAWVGAGMLARRQLAEALPRPALDGLSAPVRDAIVAADQAARSAPSAASVGALGTAYHGAQRPADALAAYALAARLDRADPRWTYLAVAAARRARRRRRRGRRIPAGRGGHALARPGVVPSG